MTSDGCGNGTARGEGGAVRGALSVGSVVACAGAAAVATAGGWKFSEVERGVGEATDESRGVSVMASDKGSAVTVS
jgi:hypothetical protein